MLNVCQIGAGSFARKAHAPGLKVLCAERPDRLRMAGVADLDCARPTRAAALASEFGYAAAYRCWRDMLSTTEPGAIVCVVDPGKTAALLRELLPMRIPILVEKPQALTLTDARELADLADLHKAVTYVAFNRRRMPGIECAKCWIAQSAGIRYLRAQMLRTRPAREEFCVRTGVHVLDTLRYLGGEVEWIDSEARRSSSRKGVDYRIQLRLRSGAVAEVSILGEQPCDREEYIAVSESARLEVVIPPPYTSPSILSGVHERAGDQVRRRLDQPTDHLRATGILPEYERFLACVASGERPDCALGDARLSVELALAAQDGHSGRVSDYAGSSNTVEPRAKLA